MALIFYSNRGGRDEAVHFAAQQRPPNPR
jgi:hypothetical protein